MIVLMTDLVTFLLSFVDDFVIVLMTDSVIFVLRLVDWLEMTLMADLVTFCCDVGGWLGDCVDDEIGDMGFEHDE